MATLKRNIMIVAIILAMVSVSIEGEPTTEAGTSKTKPSGNLRIKSPQTN